MVRNLGGPFGVAILSTIFSGHTADQVKQIFGQRLIEQGVSPTMLRELPRLQELAQQSVSSLTPEQLQQLSQFRELEPVLQEAQAFAHLHGMVPSFGVAFWAAAGFCALGVILAFFIKEVRRHEFTWAPEALLMVQKKFQPEYLSRAKRGYEAAAGGKGINTITTEFIAEIGKGWKNRQPA